jgi:hypothetical protein
VTRDSHKFSREEDDTPITRLPTGYDCFRLFVRHAHTRLSIDLSPRLASLPFVHIPYHLSSLLQTLHLLSNRSTVSTLHNECHSNICTFRTSPGMRTTVVRRLYAFTSTFYTSPTPYATLTRLFHPLMRTESLDTFISHLSHFTFHILLWSYWPSFLFLDSISSLVSSLIVPLCHSSAVYKPCTLLPRIQNSSPLRTES